MCEASDGASDVTARRRLERLREVEPGRRLFCSNEMFNERGPRRSHGCQHVVVRESPRRRHSLLQPLLWRDERAKWRRNFDACWELGDAYELGGELADRLSDVRVAVGLGGRVDPRD